MLIQRLDGTILDIYYFYEEYIKLLSTIDTKAYYDIQWEPYTRIYFKFITALGVAQEITPDEFFNN